MAVPIWKDYIISLGSINSVPFRIRLDDSSGDIIYTGQAYKRPNAATNDIRINEICADWLATALPTMAQAQFTALDLPVTFYVEKYTGGSWSEADTVQFLYDWSYDYDYDVDTDGMAFPINGKIQLGMWFTYTVYNADDVTVTVHLADGTSYQVVVPVAISADFNDDYNSDFARAARAAGSGTVVIDPSQWADVVRVEAGGISYDVVNACARYALYYLNAYGGWDFLLMEFLPSQQDALTRHTIETEYDNRTPQNRGRWNYVNEVVKSYTLRTGWLTDEQAGRMHHLLNSTNVYLYDMVLGQMIPVTIPSNRTEYKTYRTNGARLVNYEVTVEEARNRDRR